MGYIGHKFGLHPLVLYFFIHSFFKAFLDLLQFFLDWIKQTDVPLDGHVKMTVCQLVGRFEEYLIFLLKVFCVFSQE